MSEVIMSDAGNGMVWMQRTVGGEGSWRLLVILASGMVLESYRIA